MQHGFIKVASATPLIKVADCRYNAEQILFLVEKAYKEGVHLLVLPQLCVTGYTCQDLFLQQTLLSSAKNYTAFIAENVPKNMVVVFGTPIENRGKIYNCAAVASSGKLLGLVPKTLNCLKIFDFPISGTSFVDFGVDAVPISKNLVFVCNRMSSFRFGCEIGDEISAVYSPAQMYVQNGANIIVNLAAFESYSGRKQSITSLVTSKSAALKCAYVFSDVGEGESTTDNVYTGQNLICENGTCIASQHLKENTLLISEIDLKYIEHERQKDAFFSSSLASECKEVDFDIEVGETSITRDIPRNPFLSGDQKIQRSECEKMFTLQALGLKKRIEHINAKTAVIGISGGLDSTLALLVTVRVFEMLGKSKTDIICVTLPCFGTSVTTKSNAISLVESLECTLRAINISDAVMQHFKDINHDSTVFDTTYENAQARERTQVLMDIANAENGLVIGTGDLSELALGWATYNGDHMSMYSVNASVPKTVMRAIVSWRASLSDNDKLNDILYAILDTPVSPELVPGTQNTEDIIGPYELHDFFIYYTVNCGFSPSKIFRMAKYAFSADYSEDVILKYLKLFCRRFFTQQFKRSCMPDGPKVTSVSLSPRGAFAMPSDASYQEWLRELDSSLI